MNAAAPARGSGAGVWWLVALFVVALSWRVGYLERFVPGQVLAGDEGQYATYSLNLVRHGVYSSTPPGSTPVPDTYRSPGLPLLGASMMAVFGVEGGGWYYGVLYAQALIGALTALLTALLVRQWLPPPWALAAGFAIACWPHSIAMTGYFLIETLYAFTLVLALWLIVRAGAGGNRSWWLASGTAVGLATAVNPVALPLVLLMPMLVAWLRGWRPALTLAVASMLVPAAWSIETMDWAGQSASRERAAFNFVFGMYRDGHQQWFDFRVRNDAEAATFFARVDDDTARVAAERGIAFELLADRAAETGTLDLIRWYLIEKPWLFWDWSIRVGQGDLAVNKLDRPPFQVDPPFRILASIAKAANPLLVALAALACVYVLLGWRRRDDPRALALAVTVTCVLMHTAVHVVLQAEPRYSIPLRPLQLALAIAAIWWLWTRWQAYREAQRR
jgi:4-amino-4-deoxy-L-arabinose transferase-like glycosyltransferase